MREIRLNEKCRLWIDNKPVLPGTYTSFSNSFVPRTNQHLLTLTAANNQLKTFDPEEISIYMEHSPVFPNSDRASSDRSVLSRSSVWRETQPDKPSSDTVDKLFSPRQDWINKWRALMEKGPNTKGSDYFVFSTTNWSGKPLSEAIKKLTITQHDIPILYESPLRQVIALGHNYRTGCLFVYYKNPDNKIYGDSFLLNNSSLEIDFNQTLD